MNFVLHAILYSSGPRSGGTICELLGGGATAVTRLKYDWALRALVTAIHWLVTHQNPSGGAEPEGSLQ